MVPWIVASDVVLVLSFLGPAISASLYGLGLVCTRYAPQLEAIGVKLPFGKGGDIESPPPIDPDELNARAGSVSPEQRARDRALEQSMKAVG